MTVDMTIVSASSESQGENSADISGLYEHCLDKYYEVICPINHLLWASDESQWGNVLHTHERHTMIVLRTRV